MIETPQSILDSNGNSALPIIGKRIRTEDVLAPILVSMIIQHPLILPLNIKV